MGRRGPAPAPRVMQVAKGETRPSRVNYEEPVFDGPASPDPPNDLTGAGRKEWREQIGRLTTQGVVTAADLRALEDYCRALTELRRFEAAAKKAGPELAIAKGFQGMVVKLRAQCNQLRQQLGLTPSSRRSIRATPASTDPDEMFFGGPRGVVRRA